MTSFRVILGATIAAHAMIFIPAGFLSIKPQYGVTLAPSSMDVSIVQMPEPRQVMDATAKVLVAKDPVPEAPPVPAQKESLKFPEPKVKEPPKPSQPRGQVSVSAASTRGAISEAKADYLKNPPPVYPMLARRHGWEGIVILLVGVNEKGRTEQVHVGSTSGFRVLDDAAVRAVREWVFSPAHLGSITLSSEVKIPIRFQLTESQ